MDRLWNLVETHASKMLGASISINVIEFIMMLIHALDDGKISHQELEALLKVGDGVSLMLLTLVLGYLKFKKK